MLRVGVFGAAGRMGTAVCEAVGADPALELVAVVDPARAGEKLGPFGLVAARGPEVMADAGVQVAVDFTVAPAAQANAVWCADNGVHSVIGTTGFSPAVLAEIKARFEASVANCLIAPNFAIGAVLMMRFAAEAARHMAAAEIIELHHDRKLDAPSGTAARTAELMAAASGRPAPPIHSVRLPGLVAHQEVILGDTGQTLTIRHDSLDRESFMPGMLLAVRRVGSLERSPVVGLEALLFEGS